MIEATESDERPTGRSVRQRLAGLRLRFQERSLEEAFRQERFELNRGNVRFAFLAGIGLWIGWGLLVRRYILVRSELDLDTMMRFGVFIPMLLAGYAFSYTRIFARIWEWFCAGLVIATIVIWVYYAANILTLPPDFGYVGVILITAFTYTLLRLRFVLVALVSLVGIVVYLPYIFSARYVVDVTPVLASLYLLSFGMLGGLAAYWLERFARQLFIRQRQLDQERMHSEILLLNILPQAVMERLKTSSGERIVEAFDEVSVLFVDAVGSTDQASRTTPESFAETLDELFRRFDAIADTHGLEKIKTIGDAYMAVAGVPVALDRHAEAAVGMAADVLAESPTMSWPTGEPVIVRVGIATGPAVAGVVGMRKFAYDVWGDTVNLASRLEEQAEPGQALVSDRTVACAADRFGFGPGRIVDLKGKGPTRAHRLLGRSEPSFDATDSANRDTT